MKNFSLRLIFSCILIFLFSIGVSFSQDSSPLTIFPPGLSTTWVDSTSSATDDCGFSSSPDHQYEVVIPSDGTWTFSLCVGTTNFDTQLFLGNGVCSDNIGSNDNGCVAGRSLIQTPLCAGNYHLTIEGVGPVTGDYTLTIFKDTLIDLPVYTPCPPNIPVANDPGDCGAIVNWTAPSFTYICQIPFETISHNPGDFFPIGITSVKYEATNGNGVDSCVFSVTVLDNEPPTIICPGNINVPNDAGVCSANVTYPSPIDNDNCLGFFKFQSLGLASGSDFPVGISINKYIVIDASGNIDSCLFVVTVSDTLPPVITCLADTNIYVLPGQCDFPFTYPAPTLVDNCPGTVTSIVGGLGTGSLFPLGSTLESYLSIDLAGLTGFCSFTVNVLDTISPIIDCPSDSTVLNDPGSCDAIFSFSIPTGTDNCTAGPVLQVSGLLSGALFPAGPSILKFQMTDSEGNIDSCSYVVTVIDGQAPSIGCPGPIMAGNTFNQCNANIAYPPPIVFDNCSPPVVTLTSGLGSGSTFPVGISSDIYEVSDANGNTSSCSVIVNISDTESPVISCPNDTLVPVDPTTCSASVSFSSPVISDNCLGTSFSQIMGASSGSLFPLGVTIIGFEGIDASGNLDSCFFNIDINDDESPTIFCPSDSTVLSLPAVCAATISYQMPVAIDNCGGVTVSQTTGLGSGSSFPVGVSNETYLAMDDNGNSVSCSFNITVLDPNPPAITCPLNMTVANDPGSCGATITYAPIIGTDDCAGATTALNSGIGSGNFFPIGTFTEEFIVSDAGGLTAICSFDITIIDNEGPVLVCPSDTQVYVLSTNCGALITYPSPLTTDNCGAPTLSLISGNGSGATFPIGTSVESFESIDGNSNISTCSFNIEVTDSIPPSGVCPNDTIIASALGFCGANFPYPLPAFSDNCPSGFTFVLNSGIGSGNFFPVGVNIEDFSILDSVGNSTNCIFNVTVNDIENPQIVCPIDTIIDTDVGSCAGTIFYSLPSGIDNCAGSVVSLFSGNGPGVFPLGTTTETIEIVDANGNSTDCSFNIQVIDNENPTFVCPLDTSISVNPGICGGTFTFLPPSLSDNCGILGVNQLSGLSSGSTFPVGSTNLTFSGTDLHGNTSSCSYLITVIDDEPPVINCPAISSVNALPGLCGNSVIYPNPIFSDNCIGGMVSLVSGIGSGAFFPAGISEEVFVATDAFGNTDSCSVLITVIDIQTPVISCPPNMVMGTLDSCGLSFSYSLPTISDNCTGALLSLSSGIGSGNFFPLGTSNEFYIVTDSFGNIAACNFSITVNDVSPPEIICPPNIVSFNDIGDCGTTINYPVPTYSDNCGISTFFQTAGLGSGSYFPVGVEWEEFIAFDNSGNSAVCSLEVKVVDNELPVLTCPSDTIISLIPGFCEALVDYDYPTFTDNCPSADLVMISGNGPNTLFSSGDNFEVFKLTDISGNIVTCQFNVLIEDNQPPNITCDGDVVVDSDPTSCGAIVNYPILVSNDNCPGSSISMIYGTGSGGFFPVGSSNEIYQAVDQAGNISQCSFDVIVLDIQYPEIVCPTDTIVLLPSGDCNILVGYTPPTGEDNCPGNATTQLSGLGPFSVFDAGINLEEYLVVDASGNTDTCRFIIDVQDNEGPDLICPSPITVNNLPGTCFAPVVYSSPTATDNCALLSVVQVSGLGSSSSFPVGITNEVYEAQDTFGNITSCSIAITVLDTIDPTITCPPDAVMDNDPGVCSAVYLYPPPVVNDLCQVGSFNLFSGLGSGGNYPFGVNTEIWVVYDTSGNGASCSFTVTVNDGESSVLSCPNDTTINNMLGQCGSFFSYPLPMAADNCSVGPLTQIAGLGSGNLFPVGFNTEVFEGLDSEGNLATCSFNITVVDTLKPSIICPSNISQSTTIGLCGSVISYSPPTFSDNCGIVSSSLSSGMASGSFFMMGTHSVQWQAQDSSGNISSCQFEIEIIDNELPQVNCPLDISVTSTPGQCGATLTYSLPVGVDFCGTTTTTLVGGIGSGGFFPVGSNIEIYDISDGNGGVVTCTFEVFVTDNQAPILTCPTDTLISSSSGNCNAFFSYSDPIISDNCTSGVLSLTSGMGSGNFFPFGNNTESYLFTDNFGNSATCSFTVQVSDLQPPVITCPGDTQVIQTTNVCGTIVTYSSATATDNCSAFNISLQSGFGNGGFFGVGSHTEVYIATDLAGNSSTCSFTIAVEDGFPPSISCPLSIQVSSSPGSCGKNVSFSDATSTDNCGSSSISLLSGIGSGGFFPIGINVVVFQASDLNGNSSSCGFNISVIDEELPSIACPSDTAIASEVGACGATFFYSSPSVSDNCTLGGGAVFESGLNSGSFFPIGSSDIIYSVTDIFGNTSTCSFEIIVIDTQPPTITCPSNLLFNNDAGECGKTISYPGPSIFDNCIVVNTLQYEGLVSGSFFGIGSHIISFESIDAFGLKDSCSFNISVLDNELPTLTCPPNMVVNNDFTGCGAIVNYPDPTVSDNCPGGSLSLVSGSGPGVLYPVGTYLEAFEFIDPSGNIANCSFSIMVIDTIIPSLNCPSSITVSSDSGNCGAVVTFTQPGGNDNCPGITISMLAGQISGSIFPLGTTTQVFEASDILSNSATCSFTVTVEDNEDPILSCPLNFSQVVPAGQCGVIVNYAAPSVSENCGLDQLVHYEGLGAGSVFPIGSTIESYYAVDNSGNTHACSFAINIIDNQNPEIVCPVDITVSNDPGSCGGTVLFPTPFSSDNCVIGSATLVAGFPSGSIFPIGITTVGFAIYDSSGNTGSCSFEVSVSDLENPVLTCPVDISVSADANGCGTNIIYSAPVFTDNCLGGSTSLISGLNSGAFFPVGETVQVYEGVDNFGNTGICTFSIIVSDQNNPVLVCPGDITVSNDVGSCGALVNYSLPLHSDNCLSILNQMTGLGSGSVFPQGLTEEKFVAVDTSGNSVHCSFFIEVFNSSPPTLSCPSDTVVFTSTGGCQKVVDYSGVGIVNQCPGYSYNQISGIGSGGIFPIGQYSEVFEILGPNGYSDSCSFNITVVDNVPPVVNCNPDYVINNDYGVCGAVVYYPIPTFSDNCGAYITHVSGFGTGAFAAIGTYYEEYLISDYSGNSVLCAFTVDVVDVDPPVFNCPSNIQVGSDSNQCGALVTVPPFNEVDNCIGAFVTQVAGLPSGSNFPVGTTPMSYNIYDASGNISTCNFLVEVSDLQAPVLSCPTDITVFAGSEICSYPVSYSLPTYSDNCGISSLVLNSGLGSGSNFPVGTHTEFYFLEDNSGNFISCNFQISVADTTGPEFDFCPNDTTLPMAFGVCGLNYFYGVPSGTDNCGVVSLVHQGGPVNGGFFPTGSTSVTYDLIDIHNNSSQCLFTIDIIDTNPPMIICPDDTVYNSGSCAAFVNYFPPVGNDDCIGFNISLTGGIGNGAFFPGGITTETYQITDNSNNTSSCSFDVQVISTANPIQVCPSDTTIVLGNGDCSSIFTYSMPSMTDGCSSLTPSLLAGQGSGGNFPIGDNDVIYSFSNGVQVVDSCTFTISISEDVAPILTCPGNIIKPSIPAVCGAIVSFSNPIGNDNCGTVTVSQVGGPPSGGVFPIGNTLLSFSGEDESGNVSACNFMVIVFDSIAPFLTCPDDTTIILGPSSCNFQHFFDNPIAIGFCNSPSVIHTTGLGSGSFYGPGVHLESYEANDGNGNIADCSFEITIMDTVSPQISCPTNIAASTDPSLCGTFINIGLPLGSDNCGTPTIELVSGNPSMNFFTVGTYPYVYEITDASGNSESCGFTVNIVDLAAPHLYCPSDTIIPATGAGAPLDHNSVTAIENCPGPLNIVQYMGPVSGTVHPAGTSIVGYYANDMYGNTDSCQFTVTVLGSSACAQPTNLQVTDLFAMMATLNWDAPAAVPEFQLAYREVGGTWTTVNLVDHFFDLSSLVPGTTYEWKVKDRCDAPNTLFGWTAVQQFTTPMGTCEPPVNLHTINITERAADMVFESFGYIPEAQFAFRPKGVGAVWATRIVIGSNVLSINEFTAGTLYEWKVRDRCNAPSPIATMFGWSTIDTFRTLPPTCTAADSLSVTMITSGSARLHWESDVPPVAFLLAYRPTSVGATWSTRLVNDLFFDATSLDGSTEYEWKVKDRCGNPGTWYGWSDVDTFITLVGTCVRPQSMNAVVGSPTEATLAWTTSIALSELDVSIRPVGSTWTVHRVFSNGLTLGSLIPGTTYEWRVRDRCNAPNNPVSNYGWSSLQFFSTPTVRVEQGASGAAKMVPSFDIYPNPFRTVLNVDIRDGSGGCEIQILDVAGKLLRKENLEINQAYLSYELKMSDYERGLYFIRIIGDDYIKTFKAIKE